MTDLQAQATAFAAMMMKDDRRETFNREDMYHAYRDAYEQGYIDCDTEGETPESQDEYFNDAPDCRYFDDEEGNCIKGLPGTPCERKGCVAYYPKVHMPTNNPLLDMRVPYVEGCTLIGIDYGVNIPNIEDKTGKNE